MPVENAAAELPPDPDMVSKPPEMTSRPAQTRVERFRFGDVTSGRSRTAATIFSRLIFQEEMTTARKVMTMPRV